ncbi:hypothetical protein Bca4012_061637 [Brassica carinata]
MVTLSFPSPSLSFVESGTCKSTPQVSRVLFSGPDKVHGESSQPKILRDVHISERLMEDFTELARENTENDLETCGTLAAFLVMVPEAFAIVVAPTDSSRSYGIFKLTDPGGMEILRDCSETGFHPHKEPEDGNPVYEHCSNVYKNSNLRFEIFDLR